MPIRVTITIVPKGREDEAQIVGSAYIENIGGDRDLGMYGYTLVGTGGMSGEMSERVRNRGAFRSSGCIKDFPRRKKGVWDLLQAILTKQEDA